MNFNEKMKEVRIDNDQTQKELATAIGCSSKQIIRYESGEQEMTISKLKSLCELYGISADYLLGLPKGLNWPR